MDVQVASVEGDRIFMDGNDSRRNTSIVLGMHRAGISALTRVLGLLGARLPDRLVPLQASDKETGFWDPVQIAQVHGELLHEVGSSWDDVAGFPKTWFGSPSAARYADRLADRVRASHADAPSTVLNDPRICRFVPLWLEVFRRIDTDPRFIPPVRDPLEVASALDHHDELTVAKAAQFWLRHVLDAERDTRGSRRRGTTYEDKIAELRRVGDRMAAALEHSEQERKQHLAEAQAASQSVQRLGASLAAVTAERDRLARELAESIAERQRQLAVLNGITASRFWRYSQPIRHGIIQLKHGRAGHGYRALKRRAREAVRAPGLIGGMARAIAWPIRRVRHHYQVKALCRELLARVPAFAAVPSPKVSIIIPAYNNIHETVECLRSIRENTSLSEYEVVVLDNVSTDVTPRVLGQVENLRYVRNPKNLGFIGSCNKGAGLARGEFLLFLNNDTLVTPGWIEELLETFRAQPGAGLVGSKLVYPDGRLQEAGAIIWNDASGWNYGKFRDPDHPEYNFTRDVDYCSGASIMIRKDLFLEIGGFDRRYAPAYYEDVDLAFEVQRRGLRVLYQPRSVVVHLEGLTHGTDLQTGIKAHQRVNQATFREKWAKELATRPAPGGDPFARFGSKQRVLVIDHIIPTHDQDAGSLRMFHILQMLRNQGCDVTFIPNNLAPLGRYLHDLQRAGIRTICRPHLTSIRDHLRESGHLYQLAWITRADIASRHLNDVRQFAPGARVVFDTVDLHFIREAREAALMGDPDRERSAEVRMRQELDLARACDVTLVVSDTEADVLRSHIPDLDVRVIPTVQDPETDLPDFETREGLVFIGGFNHPPNVDAVEFFVREIFPDIRHRLPGVTFTILGSNPPERVRALARDDVIVTGFLPDVSGHFRRARVSVAPLRYGAGVKGKVNMSMAFGVPAVVTSIAAEGMHLVDGRDVLVAENAPAFAAAVERVYRDPGLWRSLSACGLRNVEDHFSTHAVALRVHDVLRATGITVDGSTPRLGIVSSESQPTRPPLRIARRAS